MENGRIWRETCDSIICCNQNEIEDGYHHILKCKFYNNVRKEYIDLKNGIKILSVNKNSEWN